MNKRTYSFLDKVFIEFGRGLTTLFCDLPSQNPNPAADLTEPQLNSEEKKLSAQLMRVNHAGEVCAQALYYGQMTQAQNPCVYNTLAKAALEETDHLAWTSQRLRELNTHRSYLNFYWYFQSFCLGALAGFAGDRWSLGFVEETETQVSQHLQKHLLKISLTDHKSRKILEHMREDEINHGKAAHQAGAKALPLPIKFLMGLQSKILTTLALWI